MTHVRRLQDTGTWQAGHVAGLLAGRVAGLLAGHVATLLAGHVAGLLAGYAVLPALTRSTPYTTPQSPRVSRAPKSRSRVVEPVDRFWVSRRTTWRGNKCAVYIEVVLMYVGSDSEVQVQGGGAGGQVLGQTPNHLAEPQGRGKSAFLQ